MKLVGDEDSCDDSLWWQGQDRNVLYRFHTRIRAVGRHGTEGIGEPAPLKHGFQEFWSRRSTDEHRLISTFARGEVRIAGCRHLCGG